MWNLYMKYHIQKNKHSLLELPLKIFKFSLNMDNKEYKIFAKTSIQLFTENRKLF